MARKQIDFDAPSDDEPSEAPAPPPVRKAEPGWRKVVSFVCVRCGKERRSQEHLGMVCRACHEASPK